MSQPISSRLPALLFGSVLSAAWLATAGAAPPRVSSVSPAPEPVNGLWVVGQGGLPGVSITFDQAVTVPPGAVRVWSREAGPLKGVSTQLSPDGTELSLAFPSAIESDVVTVVLDPSIVNAGGERLDGEFPSASLPSFPSGDGFASGATALRFRILQGDATRDGAVDAADSAAVNAALGSCIGDADYDANADLNPDGCINVLDVWQVLDGQGGTLPSIGPSPLASWNLEPSPSAPLSEVTVSFSRALDATSVFPAALTVRKLDGSVIEASSAELAPDGKSVRFVLPAALPPCGQNRFAISNALMAADGGFASSIPFTTENLATPETPSIAAYPPLVATPTVALSGTCSGVNLVRAVSPAGSVQATVTGSTWSLTVPLRTGDINAIFVSGRSICNVWSAPATATVTSDTQAPSVAVLFPNESKQVTAATVAVSGTVGDILSGTSGITVSVNGIPATVYPGIGVNGSFEARSVPLPVGTSTLTAVATDVAGNSASSSVTVTRIVPPPKVPLLETAGGDAQSGPAGSRLAQPLSVLVKRGDGTPWPGKLVTFKVTRSDGILFRAPTEPDADGALTAQVFSDSQGLARVWWRLGSNAGVGNQRVEAEAAGSVGTPFFTATAVAGAANLLTRYDHDGQVSQVSSTLPLPLAVRVTDGTNPVSGVAVRFVSGEGGGSFAGEPEATVVSGPDGIAAVPFTLGRFAGPHRVLADFAGNPSGPVEFEATAVKPVPGGATRWKGLVVDNGGRPIGGARCTVVLNGTPRPPVLTAVDGTFTVSGLQAGVADIYVNGLVATTLGGQSIPAGTFPSLHFEDRVVVPGVTNELKDPVRLPRLDPQNAKAYSLTQETVLTCAGIEGLRLVITPGSMRMFDGSPAPEGTVVSLNQVNNDQVPMAPPDEATSPFVWTFQPGGATFDPPVRVELPNMLGLAPGSIASMLAWNHDSSRFDVIGTGRVSEDAAVIASEPGSGISIAGWGFPLPPPPPPPILRDAENCAGYSSVPDRSSGGSSAGRTSVNAAVDLIIRNLEVPPYLDGLRKNLVAPSLRVNRLASEAFVLAFGAFLADGALPPSERTLLQAAIVELNEFQDQQSQVGEWADNADFWGAVRSDCCGLPREVVANVRRLADDIFRSIPALQEAGCLASPSDVTLVLEFLGQVEDWAAAMEFALDELDTIDVLVERQREQLAAIGALLEELGPGGDDPAVIADLQARLVLQEELDDDWTKFEFEFLVTEPFPEDCYESREACCERTRQFGAQVQLMLRSGGAVSDTPEQPARVFFAGRPSTLDTVDAISVRRANVGRVRWSPVSGSFFVTPRPVRIRVEFDSAEGRLYGASPFFYANFAGTRVPFGVAQARLLEAISSATTVPLAVPVGLSVAFEGGSSVVDIGGSVRLKTTATLSDGTTQPDFDGLGKGTEYFSSNPAIATVDATGLVRGISAGRAFITVESQGRSATRRVAVTSESLPVRFAGFAELADGTPVPGAVVVSGYGGKAVTLSDGSFLLEATVPTRATGVSISAIATIRGVTYRGTVAIPAADVVPGGITDVGTIILAPSASCDGELGWLPGFSSLGPGRVNAFAVLPARSGASLHVATRIGVYRWDGTAWTVLGGTFSAPQSNQTISSLAVFDEGDGPVLFAGGTFTGVTTGAGTVSLQNIARWDGTQWTAVPGTNGSVLALAVHDFGSGPALYAGGAFTSAGGVPAGRIAAWNGTAWTGLGSGMNDSVQTLLPVVEPAGPALYAGGAFTNAGGVTANRIARWNGSRWSSLGSGMNDQVLSLAMFDSGTGPSLHAGGSFSNAGGTPASCIARWNGSAWSALGSGCNSSVRALHVFDNGSGPALYAGGGFTVAGGIQAGFIARWNGSAWSPVGVGFGPASFGAQVNALLSLPGPGGPSLVALGNFENSGANYLNGIAIWDGTAWNHGFESTSGVNGDIYDFAVFDDGRGPALYAGGFFTGAGSVVARGIARWDGSDWAPLGTGIGGLLRVNALAVFDDGNGDDLYVAGGFGFAGGIPVNRIARWDGASWSDVGGGLPGIAGEVLALEAFDDGSGNALYAAGSFATVIGGQQVARIARWNGSAWSGVGSGSFNNTVRCLEVFDDGTGPALYAGGDFSGLIARWNGSSWSPLGGGGAYDGDSAPPMFVGIPFGVYAMTVFDDGTGPGLYVGGLFEGSFSPNTSHIARWNGAEWSDLGGGVTGPFPFTYVLSLAVFDEGEGPRLFASGSFLNIGDLVVSNVARWDGKVWSNLGTGLNAGQSPFPNVGASAVFDDGSGPSLFFGGGFLEAGGIPSRGIARWGCLDGLTDSASATRLADALGRSRPDRRGTGPGAGLALGAGESLELRDQALELDRLVAMRGSRVLIEGDSLLRVGDLLVEDGAEFLWRGGTIEISGGTWLHPAGIRIGCDAKACLRLVDGAAVAAPQVTVCPLGTLEGEGLVAAPVRSDGLVAPWGEGLELTAEFTQGEFGEIRFVRALGAIDGSAPLRVGGRAELAGFVSLEWFDPVAGGPVPPWRRPCGVDLPAISAAEVRGGIATRRGEACDPSATPRIEGGSVLLSIPQSDACPDLDGNGVVDPLDAAALLELWGGCPSGCCRGDIFPEGGDGTVNGADLAEVLRRQGEEVRP